VCFEEGPRDPDVWITELEHYRMKLDELGSSIAENHFIPHILNNMTADYNLQLAKMIKRNSFFGDLTGLIFPDVSLILHICCFIFALLCLIPQSSKTGSSSK
jgi:hypothetical protein